MFQKSLTRLTLRQKDLNLFKRFLTASVIDGKFVFVQENNPKVPPLKFPSVWLRDNCQCSDCFHDHTKSRKVNWERTNVGHKILDVNADSGQKTITINWQDEHQSIFNLDWLKERNFSSENRRHYLDSIYKPPAQLWGKKNVNDVWRTFDFKSIIEKDEDLLAWLEALAIQGFGLIKNAPDDESVALQLADRIGFAKRTTYGEVFEVKSKENARNYAYLMTPLPLHTDMPYYEYKAGINILHCLVQSQSQGGANLMTDGFYVAEKLKQEHRDHFEVLLKTPVDWYDIGKDSGMEFYNIWRAPVICLDIDGNYHRINHNITKRDSHFTVPLEQVEQWYEAYDKFLELAYAEAVEFKTEPGDVFVFNNLRMLHGRTAYEDSPANKRHLIGAYVDWDLIFSKMRVLKTK